MTEVVPGVHRISLAPRNALNVYIVGDVLIDSGMAHNAKKLIDLAKQHNVKRHILTHAHIDHAGSSRAITTALGIELFCGEADVADARSGAASSHGLPKPLHPVAAKVNSWKAIPEAKVISDGEEIGEGFVALATPGHTPGHLSYWRESDRTLICGDVICNMNVITTAPGVNELPHSFICDIPQSHESIRLIADLNPNLTLPGHGRPLVGSEELKQFAAKL